MILYDVKIAPSPRRVRIFLAEKNVDVEVIQVNTAEGEHLKEDFLKLNPWATVPVLKLDDGTCISEAIACCRYLEENYPNPPPRHIRFSQSLSALGCFQLPKDTSKT